MMNNDESHNDSGEDFGLDHNSTMNDSDYSFNEDVDSAQIAIQHMTIENMSESEEDGATRTYDFLRPEKETMRLPVPSACKAVKSRFKCSGERVWTNFEGAHAKPAIVKEVPATLPKGVLDIKVLADVNKDAYVPDTKIKSVKFHKSAPLAMVAESYGRICFTQIDKDCNKHLKSILLNETKLSSVMFVGDGDEAFVGSLKHDDDYFYDLTTNTASKVSFKDSKTRFDLKTYNVSPDGAWVSMSGNEPEITVMSVKEKKIIFKLKTGAKSRYHSYSTNGQMIYTHTVRDDVHKMQVVDIRMGSSVYECRFEKYSLGHVPATQSPNGKWIAVGGMKGRVNIFNTQDIETNPAPLPVMRISNLTTPITSLRFSRNSEMLAFASNRRPSDFLMLHMNSYSIIHNFQHHSLVRFRNKTSVTDIDFSPNGAYMALGNERGKAHLYNLPHYDEY